MKAKVTIEETISQEFEVEVTSLDNAYEEIRGKYYNGDLIVDNNNVTCRKMEINNDCDWTEF